MIKVVYLTIGGLFCGVPAGRTARKPSELQLWGLSFVAWKFTTFLSWLMYIIWLPKSQEYIADNPYSRYRRAPFSTLLVYCIRVSVSFIFFLRNEHISKVCWLTAKQKQSAYWTWCALAIMMKEKQEINTVFSKYDCVGSKNMVNGIHPSRAGYRDWWTPKFEAYLSNYLAQ